MVKRWVAYKLEISEPIVPDHYRNNQVVFYRLEVVEPQINTSDGSMVAVRIRQQVELCDPSYDVAAIVGEVATIRKSGIRDPQSTWLWFWNDKFWLQAVDGSGIPYYNKKTYLLYEVEISNRDDFLGALGGIT